MLIQKMPQIALEHHGQFFTQKINTPLFKCVPTIQDVHSYSVKTNHLSHQTSKHTQQVGFFFFFFQLKSAAAAANLLQSCPTLCNPIDGRLLCPWDSPGKNTGVGCHFLLHCMKVKSDSEVAQSCLTLSNPRDCSPPGSSIHGILQSRILEWVAIPFSN